MPNIFRGVQAQVNRSDLSGRRVWKGSAVVDWSLWFDHFWQAKGAASYAASLLDLVGAQNLVEGNGAIPWAGGTGWGFVTALAQWLDTGLTPANNQSWSVLVQFTSLVRVNWSALFGSQYAAGRGLMMLVRPVVGSEWYAYHRGHVVNASVIAGGNYAVAGRQPYEDGAAVGGLIVAGATAFTHSIYIGANNNAGVADSFSTLDITAIGIKKGPALTAPQVAAAAAAMAAL